MRIGSLFSGIGGFELGLEASGIGHTVWQVEIDPFCRKVLAKHWPHVERFEDVTQCKHLPAVDLICGGFPCQDVSSAGARQGLAGSRSGLWYEFDRIVGEVQPQWVAVENVTSGGAEWHDQITYDLEQRGFRTLSVSVPASRVGAPHDRGRIFVVAHANRNGEPAFTSASQVGCEREAAADCGATANANGQQLREQPRGRSGANGEGASQSAKHGAQWDVASRHIPAERAWGRTMPFPAVPRMDDGFPHRVVRNRALGNAVVPQCAEVVGYLIKELQEAL